HTPALHHVGLARSPRLQAHACSSRHPPHELPRLAVPPRRRTRGGPVERLGTHGQRRRASHGRGSTRRIRFHRPHPPGLALLRPPASVGHLVDARATPREPRAPLGGVAAPALDLDPCSDRLGRLARTLYRRRTVDVVVGSPGHRSERRRRRLALGAEARRRPRAVALGPVSLSFSLPPSRYLPSLVPSVDSALFLRPALVVHP
ncbi:uncharacterized protein RHOBADRAFT_66019, partial [Rhodotorula graminis WP1]